MFELQNEHNKGLSVQFAVDQEGSRQEISGCMHF